jgi:hypothetical protein
VRESDKPEAWRTRCSWWSSGRLPGHLLIQDREAISAKIGKLVRLNDDDESGRAELEFRGSESDLHVIYADWQFFQPAENEESVSGG